MEGILTGLIIFGVALLILLLSSIRQIGEFEKGLKFTRGKFTKIMNPGWHFVWPIFQSYRKVDIRVIVVDVPKQEAITKDNVTITINAVLYYNIFDAKSAVLAVQNYNYATSQLAQTTMRNIVGSVTLDELLTQRDKISTDICQIVDKETDAWGIKVNNIELKDIVLPVDMQRVLAKVAEAEREKAAVITKAEGEVEASKNLSEAARELSASPGALHLRTLSTINDLSSDQSNTIIFAVPLEVLRAFEGTNLPEKAVSKIKELTHKE